MTNPQTAAPGVAVERLMKMADDYANAAAQVSLDKFVNKIDDAPTRATQLSRYAELESALLTALLAGAAGGQPVAWRMVNAHHDISTDAAAAEHPMREPLYAHPPVPVRAPQEPDMRAICETLGFDPTNHHNAAKCPYCRPASGEVQVDAARLDWLQQRGATVSIVPGDGSGFAFLVAGLYASAHPDLRAAIDDAMAHQAGVSGGA